MYVINNCSVTYVTMFSKGVHCLRKITVSVTTGTTLSSPRATDNFITYKSGLLRHFLPVKQTSGERAARLGTGKKCKNPNRIPTMKDGATSPERSRFLIFAIPWKTTSFFVSNIEIIRVIKNMRSEIRFHARFRPVFESQGDT